MVPSSRVSKRRRNSFATHLGERAGRRSWTDAEHLALKLTSQLAALQCAASLAGTPMTQTGTPARSGRGCGWPASAPGWGSLGNGHRTHRTMGRTAQAARPNPRRRPRRLRAVSQASTHAPEETIRFIEDCGESQRIDVLRMGRGVLMYPTLDPPGGLRRRGGDGQHVEGAVHGFLNSVRVEQPCQLDSRVNPTWVGSGGNAFEVRVNGGVPPFEQVFSSAPRRCLSGSSRPKASGSRPAGGVKGWT